MPSSFASAVYPVPDRFINLGKEPAGQPGTHRGGDLHVPADVFQA